MTLLFGRSWAVRVGSLDVSQLDLQFVIEKSTGRTPNSCALTVFNLAANTRAQIEEDDSPTLTLRAGYGENPPVIFFGEIHRVMSEYDGLTWKTEIQARDGGSTYTDSRLDRSYPPGVLVSKVVSDCADAMNCGRGNLSELTSGLELRNGLSTFPDGFVASGPAHRTLTDILRGAGLRWSIQDNVLQIQRQGQPLQTTAYRLSAKTGMIGAPSRSTERARAGNVSVMTKLIPDLIPGKKVVLDSRNIRGNFEVRQVQYKGDTQTSDWSQTMTLGPLR